MTELTSFQRELLAVVNLGSGFGGFSVKDIAHLINLNREHKYGENSAYSALIRRECLQLEKAGLLRRLDDERPIAWCAIQAAQEEAK